MAEDILIPSGQQFRSEKIGLIDAIDEITMAHRVVGYIRAWTSDLIANGTKDEDLFERTLAAIKCIAAEAQNKLTKAETVIEVVRAQLHEREANHG